MVAARLLAVVQVADVPTTVRPEILQACMVIHPSTVLQLADVLVDLGDPFQSYLQDIKTIVQTRDRAAQLPKLPLADALQAFATFHDTHGAAYYIFVNDPHLSLWPEVGACEETLTTQALY